MMNREMEQERFEEVKAWMLDNMWWTEDFMRTHGEEWMEIYDDISTLWRGYCNSDHAELVDLFMRSDCEAANWTGYFVDDDGYVHEEDEMDDFASEVIENNDHMVELVIEDFEEGLIDEPAELVEICSKYSAPSWDDVAVALGEAYRKGCETVAEAIKDLPKSDSELFMCAQFTDLCREGADLKCGYDLLIKSMFYGASEDVYESIIDCLESDNLFAVLVCDGMEYVKTTNVPFAKAFEMSVKEYLGESKVANNEYDGNGEPTPYDADNDEYYYGTDSMNKSQFVSKNCI